MDRQRVLSVIILASIPMTVPRCSQQAPSHADRDRDLNLLPLGQARPEPIPPVYVPSGGHCEALPATPLSLVGTVMQEHRFGPPGYGETPKEDERLTIYLLHLGRPFDVCAVDVHDKPPNTIHHLTTMELTGKVGADQLARAVGTTLTVFGTLEYQSGSHDFTEVIIRVDSVPELRRVRPPQST